MTRWRGWARLWMAMRGLRRRRRSGILGEGGGVKGVMLLLYDT